MVIGVKTYTTLLSHPELIKDEQVSDLRSIIKKFPYFEVGDLDPKTVILSYFL